MELKEVYGRFMDSSEYSHLRVAFYKMSRDFYLKLLNSDCRKSFYYDYLMITFEKGKFCEIMINGYPIVLTREFKELYAFQEVTFESFYQMDDECFNEA
jgi:hypothetical protein